MTEADWIREAGGATELLVLVVPRASRTELSGLHEGRLRVRVAAPPVEGKANKELVAFFSKLLGVGKSAVAIERGESGRRKVIRVYERDARRVRETIEKVIGEVG